MKQSRIVTVSYSKGYDYKEEFVEGIQINVDNEEYAFYRTSDLHHAIETLAKFQSRGYVFKFIDSVITLSANKLSEYIEVNK